MQLFTLNRLVPSIWLTRQCLEGYFNGKVKNNALSIRNGRATPKRYFRIVFSLVSRYAKFAIPEQHKIKILVFMYII